MTLKKLEKIKKRHEELMELSCKPEIIADNRGWQKIVKEMSDTAPIAEVYDRFILLEKQVSEAKALLKTEKDADIIAMAEEEIEANEAEILKLEERAKILLLPKDENDERNVIMEIRAGAGGDEAGLFAGVLYRMYTMYAAMNGYRTELVDINESGIGGIKEVVFEVVGAGAFKNLKFESGVHRVQRVPETESQGRVHTSTATVAVLPEVEDVNIQINDKDLRIDNFCSSGAGGQHVNKTESAVRVTHIPTGVVVVCQDGRSKIKNLDKAMKVLAARLYDMEKQKKDKEYAQNRADQVGTGDRSERIRTYNYPQGRLTDHRINYTVYNLTDFVNGNISELIEALQMDWQRKQLEKASS